MSKEENLKRRAKMVKETIGARTGTDRKQVVKRIARRLYVTERTIENDSRSKY